MRADTRYNGRVVDAAWIESKRGTMGLQLQLETDADEPIDFVLWITTATKDRVARDLGELGIDQEKLKSRSYLEHQLIQDLRDVELCFGTKEEVYNGKAQIKVQYIGKPSATLEEGGITGAVAALFGGDPAPAPSPQAAKPTPTPAPGEGLEDDIPFAVLTPLLLPLFKVVEFFS